MKINTVDRTDTAPGPGGISWPARIVTRLRRLSASAHPTARSAQAEHVAELEVELALLREENARLKVKRQRARSRSVNERVRELLPVHREDAESPELLTDCMLLRNDLLDACQEIELGIRETRQRIEALELSGGGSRDAPGARDDLEHVA